MGELVGALQKPFFNLAVRMLGDRAGVGDDTATLRKTRSRSCTRSQLHAPDSLISRNIERASSSEAHKVGVEMAFKFSQSVLASVSTGLMLGAVTACGGSAPAPEVPTTSASPEAAQSSNGDKAAFSAKAACGGAKPDASSCSAKSESSGQNGCSASVPK